MECKRLTVRDDAEALARRVRGLVPGGESVSAQVAEVIAAVAARGDLAVRDYTERLDTHGEPAPAARLGGRDP